LTEFLFLGNGEIGSRGPFQKVDIFQEAYGKRRQTDAKNSGFSGHEPKVIFTELAVRGKPRFECTHVETERFNHQSAADL
jgi:hypothetical protein